MRGQIFVIDAFNSMLIFLGILLFINFVWNSSIMEFERQTNGITDLRAQQTLDLIISQMGSGHRLDEDKVILFINQTDNDYAAVKDSLGILDLNFRLMVSDWGNNLLYYTSELPEEQDILVIRRVMYMGQPVRISLWVWE